MLDNGMTHLRSPYSVPETLKRLESIVQGKGLKIFELLDHGGEAEKVALKMRPMQLLLFGSPQAGTPVMLAAPTVAIDLPLKALAWEDGDGQVWLSYNSPEYLRNRHNIPEDLLKNLAGAGALLELAVRKD